MGVCSRTVMERAWVGVGPAGDSSGATGGWGAVAMDALWEPAIRRRDGRVSTCTPPRFVRMHRWARVGESEGT